MSSMLRHVAGTAALAVAGSALTLPFAAPALAVGPTERMFTVVDSDDDGSYGLSYTDVPGGTPTVVDENAARDVSDLTVSGDGSRIAYVRYTATKVEIVVADAAAPATQAFVATSVPVSDSVFVSDPLLSPDGSTLAWTYFTFSASGITLSTKKVSFGSSATTVANGYGGLAFLDGSTLLVQSLTGANKSVAVTGGALTAVSGLPTGVQQVAVAPSGTAIAWSEDTSTNPDVSTASVTSGTLAGNGGTWSVTSPHTLSTALDNEQPSFSRDSANVYWVRYDGDVGPGSVLVRDTLASGAASTAEGTTDHLDVAVATLPGADVTAPGAATASPFTLQGTGAVIAWTNPVDADLSGVIVSRPGKSAFVPAPVHTYADSGLTVGTAYPYTITAVDRSGNQATGATRSLRAIAPGAYFGDPTSKYSTKTSFPVRFATGDNGSATYVVKYLPYGGTLKTWVAGATGATRTFGVAGNGTTVADTTALAGGTYKFAVTVTDEYGNASAATVSGQAVVPFDQSRATYNLSSSVASSSAYLGSYKKISSTSAYAKVTLVGDRLQVIGFRCASCGSFAIYDGTTKIGTVSTYSATTVARTVLFTKTYTGNATHTFWIRPLGTAGHPTVALDGYAMRRK